MKLAVLVKQVPDMNAVKIDRASGKPLLSGQQVINSYDGYAIEAALRLRDAHGGEVVVVTAGPPPAKDAITRALAMGADRGIHVELANPNDVDTLALAGLLASQLRALEPDVVFAGQTADDYEDGQVGPQVAELLGVPLVSNVVEILVEGDRLILRRDMEDGYQTVETAVPVLLLSSTGLDEPRLPSLKGIMAAKKKPVERLPAEAASANGRVSWSDPAALPRTAGGTLIQDIPAADAAKQLVAWLRENKLL